MISVDLSSAPAAIIGLVEWLRNAGLAPVTLRADGRANQLIEISGPQGLGVHLTADRGQWFVDIGRMEWQEWFDADVWSACLSGNDVPLEPSPLAIQVQWIEDQWSSLVALGTRGPLECLIAKRRERAQGRLGLPFRPPV
jgi:hypothetical protein